MPWTAEEASSHNSKLKTPAQKAKWAAIANSALKTYKGNEGRAIAVANAAFDDGLFSLLNDHDDESLLEHHENMPGGGDEWDEDDEEEMREALSDGVSALYDWQKLIWTGDRDFSAKAREHAEKTGAAMKGGGYPIVTRGDLENAIRAIGRAKDPAATKAHIVKRARALGLTKLLPKDWSGSTKDSAVTTFLEVNDTVPLGKWTITDEGYLKAYPRVARVGIQTYKGFELGRPDLGDVRVYRPASEVFKKDAVESLAHIPVTFLHPTQMVDASNWKQHAVGETGDEVMRDGEAIRVPMMVKDGATVDAIRTGRAKELSVGYGTELRWRQGVTDSGEPYDAMQTAIRANHLAVVPVARGGSSLRIGDDQRSAEGVNIMQTIMLDGIPVEVKDEQAAQIIARHIKKLNDEKADLVGKLDKAAADKEEADEDKVRGKKEFEAKDGQIAMLKKQLADAQSSFSAAALDKAVNERMGLITAARKVMDAKFVTDGKESPQIMREVVTVHYGDASVKDWSDDKVAGAFLLVTKDASKSNGVRTLADGLSRYNAQTDRSPTNDATEARDAAYNDRIKRANDAWRTAGRLVPPTQQ